MTEALASKTCTPCRGGIPPLTREQAELFHAQAPEGTRAPWRDLRAWRTPGCDTRRLSAAIGALEGEGAYGHEGTYAGRMACLRHERPN